MKKLAVAILNWNGKSWLEKFLPQVVLYSSEAEIFVIDNASTDGSLLFLQENFPEVKIIINEGNYGFAEGYNKGLSKIEAEYYCLLNSDVEVTKDWILPILALFEKDEKIAAIQPKILSYNEKNKFEFAGAAGGMIDNLGYPYCRGRIFEDIETDNGQYDDECEVFWASGAALFIRVKDFWKENGFDEVFFAHQEEIDLCWRLKNSGKKIFYTYKSTVYHVGGGTLRKQNPQKTYLNFRNNLMMLLKNLPFPQTLWILFLRLNLDGVAGIYLGYKNGFSHLWVVVRAHFAFYKRIPYILKQRKRPQIPNYYQCKGIVFRHFLRK